MRDRIERALAAWGHFAYRRAPWVVAAVLVGVAPLLVQVAGLAYDTSTEGFFPEDDPVRIAYDEFRERFGSDARILVAVDAPEVFDLATLGKLRALHRDIEEEVPHLVEVTSLVNARETRGVGNELVVGELLEDWPASTAEVAEIERRVLANPLYIDNFISRDGSITTLVLEIEAYSSVGTDEGFDDFDETIAQGETQPFLTGEENTAIVSTLYEVLDRHDAPDFRLYATGTPVMTEELQREMRADMVRFALLAILLIVVFLAALFRTVAGVALPMITVLLAVACTLGLMAATGTPLTLPTQIVPSFLLAVGVGGSVHILAIFYQAQRRGESKRDSIAYSLGHSGLAVAMTGLTTAGGLFSFTAAELRPIAHLGVFAPAGVLMALVFTLALLPALIAIFPMHEGVSRRRRGPAVTQRLVVAMGEFATRHAWAVTGTWAVLIVLGLAGTPRLELSHSPYEFFPDGHRARLASDLINDRMNGSLFVEFLVDTGEENGLHDPALLRGFEAVAERAAATRMDETWVGKTVSLADIVKEIHQALNENRPAFHAVPTDRQLVAQELLLFENSGSDDLEDFVDPLFRLGRISMKIPFADAVLFPPLFQALREHVDAELGDRVEFKLTGLGVLAGEMIPAVMHSIVRSYSIAFVVICALLVLLIGRIRIGLVAMIPNLAPIILTLGIMGWTGIPLDAFTMLIGSIAIGLAVDDTIHFMHNFRRYYEQGGDVLEAVRDTLTTTGQALLFTSLVLSTGFLTYAFARMTILHHFGVLTASTIMLAFLADVLLAPALMVLVARRTAEATAPLSMEATR